MDQMKRNDLSPRQVLRNRYLAYRNSLSPAQRSEMSAEVRTRLQQEDIYQKARILLVYMDYRSEVITSPLVEELLLSGKKRIFAPRVEGMDIRFYEVFSLSDFTTGYQGIREPRSDPDRLFTFQLARKEPSLLLVPGAVFDRNRGRMGYGKGFYDRFLSAKGECPLVSAALAFDCQIAGKVPVEAHDRKPDMIVTNTETIR